MQQKRQSHENRQFPNSDRPPAPPPTSRPPQPQAFSSPLPAFYWQNDQSLPQNPWYPPELLLVSSHQYQYSPVLQYQAPPPLAANGVQHGIAAFQQDFIHTTPVDGDLEQTQAYRVSVQPLGPPQLTRRDPQQQGSHFQENNRPAYSHHGNRRPMNSRQMDDNWPWRDYQQTNRRQGSPMNAPSMIGGHAVQYGQHARARAFRGTARVVEVEDMEAQAQRRGRSNRSRRDSYHPPPRALPKVRSYSPQRVEPPSRATGPKFQGPKASIHIRGRGNRAQVKQSHSTFRTLGKHSKTELKSETSDYPRSISRTPPRQDGNVKVDKRSASPNRARSISLIPFQNEVKVKLEPRSESPEPMRRATSLSVGYFIKTEPESEAPEPVSTLMVAPALVESKARSETTEPMNQNTGARGRASRWVNTPLAGIKRKREDCSISSYGSYEDDYQDKESLAELFKKVKLY